jgi:hypothetical protein
MFKFLIFFFLISTFLVHALRILRLIIPIIVDKDEVYFCYINSCNKYMHTHGCMCVYVCRKFEFQIGVARDIQSNFINFYPVKR